MNSIAVNIIMLLLKGIPEGLLSVAALHILTQTKIEPKKYCLITFIYVVTTYLIRLLPIQLGVNTVLVLLTLILSFQFVHKNQLSKVIRSIISVAVILIILAMAELLNIQLLVAIYGTAQAENLYKSKDGLIQSISTFPSTIFFAIFVFIVFFIAKKFFKKEEADA